MAEEITARVHSPQDLENAIAASSILFGKATEDQLRSTDAPTLLSVFEGVPQFEIKSSQLTEGVEIVDFLSEHTAVFTSKGEARKMVQGGGVAINKTKVTVDKILTANDIVAGGMVIVQKGKKNYFLVNVR